MGDLKGAPAVHFNFPQLSFYLCTTFKTGIAPIPLEKGRFGEWLYCFAIEVGFGANGSKPSFAPARLPRNNSAGQHVWNLLVVSYMLFLLAEIRKLGPIWLSWIECVLYLKNFLTTIPSICAVQSGVPSKIKSSTICHCIPFALLFPKKVLVFFNFDQF